MSSAVITTNGGTAFDFAAPAAHEFSIRDIARALARICRFGGHVKPGVFYSVAEHSVRVSLLCPDELAYHGLMHDAAEAFIGDVVSPFKNMPEMVGYRIVERRVEEAIGYAFGLDLHPMPAAVHQADMVMRVTEQRDIRDGNEPGLLSDAPSTRVEVRPLAETIVPWSIEQAELAFLTRYTEVAPAKWRG